jgi:lipoprotein-releasing system permease protein
MERDTGEVVTMYMVRNEEDIKPRPFRIKGVYSTGLEDFDKKYVFIDQRHVQKVNSWGVQAQLSVAEKCSDGRLTVEGFGYGGNGDLDFNWNIPEWSGPGLHTFELDRDTVIQLIVSDDEETVPDTAWLKIQCPAEVCCDSVISSISTSGGSYNHYTGGYDVFLTDMEHLEEMDELIYKSLPFDLQTRNVVDQNPEIFNWLEMLDINVYIIIGLMVFISLVNMTSALLIIILERTNMIGLLKAFGAHDRSLLKIFIRYAAAVIGIGLLAGNILGVGLCLLQQYQGIIKLDPSTYFVDTVPVLLNPGYLISLNLATVFICIAFLVVPGMYVSKISPVRAIRFD